MHIPSRESIFIQSVHPAYFKHTKETLLFSKTISSEVYDGSMYWVAWTYLGEEKKRPFLYSKDWKTIDKSQTWPSQSLFLWIKFYWNTAILICLHVVCFLFHKDRLDCCNRDHRALKPKVFTSVPLLKELTSCYFIAFACSHPAVG